MEDTVNLIQGIRIAPKLFMIKLKTRFLPAHCSSVPHHFPPIQSINNSLSKKDAFLTSCFPGLSQHSITNGTARLSWSRRNILFKTSMLQDALNPLAVPAKASCLRLPPLKATHGRSIPVNWLGTRGKPMPLKAQCLSRIAPPKRRRSPNFGTASRFGASSLLSLKHKGRPGGRPLSPAEIRG